MERKLISEDKTFVPKLHRNLNSFSSYLGKVLETYNEMEMGEFDGNVWKKIRTSGARSFEEAHQKGLDNQLQKAGVTNSALRANMMEGIKVQYFNFEKAVEELVKKVNSRDTKLSIKNIDYVDGQFVITDETEESLLDAHGRIYLETKEEFDLYEQAENVKKALLNISDTLLKLKHPDAKNYRKFVSKLLQFNDDDILVNINEIKYASTIIHQIKKNEAMERENRRYLEEMKQIEIEQKEKRAEKLRKELEEN